MSSFLAHLALKSFRFWFLATKTTVYSRYVFRLNFPPCNWFWCVTVRFIPPPVKPFSNLFQWTRFIKCDFKYVNIPLTFWSLILFTIWCTENIIFYLLTYEYIQKKRKKILNFIVQKVMMVWKRNAKYLWPRAVSSGYQNVVILRLRQVSSSSCCMSSTNSVMFHVTISFHNIIKW